MFFHLSKILWWFTAPSNGLLLLLGVGVLLLWTPWRRAGRWVVTLGIMLLFVATTMPVGSWMLNRLENRFPAVSALPSKIDGIIVLGGVVNQFLTKARGQISIGDPAERLTAFAELAHRYPKARLIFSGGSALPFRQDLKEADVLGPIWPQIGLDPNRVVYENRSRNTYENAKNTFELAHPRPGETWILITSAFHMPRAVGCFRRVGWAIVPYPVDYRTEPVFQFSLSPNLSDNLSILEMAVHEWLGLFFYWWTDRIDSVFPSPNGS